MNCPHCSATNADGARFCGGCGQAMLNTSSVPDARVAEPPSLIGREIAGRFRILAKLGEGGMGAVYRAEQISLKRTVAVKLLRPEVASSALLLRRFNAEAEAVAKLSHPNTVGIYDFGQDTDGTLFISMEYIEGKSLRSVVHQESPLHPARALAIALQISASLIDAHSHGIVHRDLKPDNVMLQDRGRQRDVVRVLDFGIAKLRDEGRQSQMAMTQAGDMLGTPQYMAPEQIRAEEIDGRTDVYALGCILYEMITARLPFEAPTVMALLSKHLLEPPLPPSQRRPDLVISREVDDLVMAAMAKLPIARPQTMEIYAEQIAQVLAITPPDPNAPPPATGNRIQGIPSSGGAFTPAAGPQTPAPSYPSPAPHIPLSHTGPAPQAPQAPHAPQQPYSPFPPQAPQQAYVQQPPPKKKSNVAIWIIVALLLAGGGGTLAYVLTRHKATAGTTTTVSSGGDTTTPPSGDDPWAVKPGPPVDAAVVVAPPDAPEAEPDAEADDDIDADDDTGSDDPDTGSDDLDTAMEKQQAAIEAAMSGTLAMPAGVSLNAPSGFTKTDIAGMSTVSSADNKTTISAMPDFGTSAAIGSLPDQFVVMVHHRARKAARIDSGGTQQIIVFISGTNYSLLLTVTLNGKSSYSSPEALGKLLDSALVLPDDT